MAATKALKWGSFAYEAFLSVPFVGGLFVVANGYLPLFFAFVLHLITVIAASGKAPIGGNILGIITSLLAWIPILGWFLHFITAIWLLAENLGFFGKRY